MTGSRRARSLLDETGFAVPLALAILLTTVLLATVATAIAIQATHLSRRDANAKAAIEAANSGLRTAVYRLNTYQPAATSCPPPSTGTVDPTYGLCAPVTETLGNNESYEYWISGAPPNRCAGASVSSSQSDVAQRCITSVGTANGVSARVQQRVAAYTSTPAFPAAIFGTKSVTISNNVTITSDTPGTPGLLGTNGTLCVACTSNNSGGTTTIDGYELPPGATVQLGNNVTNVGPTTGLGAPYPTPTPIYPFSTSQNTAGPPYDSISSTQAGTCYQQTAQSLGWSGTWVQTNCDYEISQGIQYPLCLSAGLPVHDCDATTVPSADWDPNGRTLYMPNNSTLVLQGGYYNFCSLWLNNGSQITVPFGAKVTIFIDSPSDSTSHCATTNSAQGVPPGTFSMQQNSTIGSGATALNTQILLYGDQSHVPPTNTVNLNNNGSSSFALLAPFSNVNMSPSSNSTFHGAVVGYSVTLGQSSNFTYEADTSSFQSTSIPIFYPSYWEQCPTQSSSGSDPTAGC